MTKSAPPPGADQQPSSFVGKMILLFIALLAAYTCGKEDQSTSTSTPLVASASTQPVDTNATQPETEAPAQPIAAAIIQAGADVERAVGALGASGARLYSENCYAFLAKNYTAAARDRCLAFDLLAAKMTSDISESPGLEWFDASAINARFTEATIAAGEAADLAQLHFTSVESLTRTMSVTPVVPPDALSELAHAPPGTPTLTNASTETQTSSFDSLVQEVEVLADDGLATSNNMGISEDEERTENQLDPV